jgi:hypothetical protein
MKELKMCLNADLHIVEDEDDLLRNSREDLVKKIFKYKGATWNSDGNIRECADAIMGKHLNNNEFEKIYHLYELGLYTGQLLKLAKMKHDLEFCLRYFKEEDK